MLGLGCTSDDEISSRGHAVHLCLHHAHVFPTVLQLDVPDHQIPRGTLGEHRTIINANTPPQSLMFSLQREKKSTKNVKLFKNHVVGQQITAHLQLHASCLGVFSQKTWGDVPFWGEMSSSMESSYWEGMFCLEPPVIPVPICLKGQEKCVFSGHYQFDF